MGVTELAVISLLSRYIFQVYQPSPRILRHGAHPPHDCPHVRWSFEESRGIQQSLWKPSRLLSHQDHFP